MLIEFLFQLIKLFLALQVVGICLEHRCASWSLWVEIEYVEYLLSVWLDFKYLADCLTHLLCDLLELMNIYLACQNHSFITLWLHLSEPKDTLMNDLREPFPLLLANLVKYLCRHMISNVLPRRTLVLG